jgi:hypothetical protein
MQLRTEDRTLIDRRTLLLALAGLTLPMAAHSQAEWLKKGQDLLGKDVLGKGGASGSGLSQIEIGEGLCEALRIGSSNVVSDLGRTDGFYGVSDVHIPLPGALGKVQKALKLAGQSGLTDDLEQRMNRAAEAAVPKAKDAFVDAIDAMTIDDAHKILSGPNDSATRYFESKMTPRLTDDFTPIVNQELAASGAVKAYDNTMGEYAKLPFVPDAKANLSGYVVEKALDGVFLYLAREEAAIRDNPAARTTGLLRKVFGS